MNQMLESGGLILPFIDVSPPLSGSPASPVRRVQFGQKSVRACASDSDYFILVPFSLPGHPINTFIIVLLRFPSIRMDHT